MSRVVSPTPLTRPVGAAPEPYQAGSVAPVPLLKRWKVDPIAIVGVTLAFALWYLASWVIGEYMPPPHAVIEHIVSNFFGSDYLEGITLPEGGFFPHLVTTTITVVVGVGIGTLVGVVSGLCSARWRVMDQIMDPVVSIFGTLPIIVVAPFFLIWFGLVWWAQVALVAFYASLLIHLYALRALRNVNPRYLEYAYTLGATFQRTFLQVCLPAAIPEIFGGIRTAFNTSWGISVMAELLGAEHGVGRVIISLGGVFDVTGIMGMVLQVGIVAMLLDSLLVQLRNYFTRWSDAGART